MEYIILDIETTGLDLEHSSIIEVGAILVSGGKIKEEFYSFVRYDAELLESTKRITGISDEMLKGAPTLHEVITDLQRFIQKYPVVAHNGFSFDFRILERDGLKISEKLDSMEISFFILPINVTGHSMSALAKRFSLGEVPHRALPDCKLEFAVLQKLQGEWIAKDQRKTKALKSLAQRTGWWWTQFLMGTSEGLMDITELVHPHVPYRKSKPEQDKLPLQTQAIDREQVQSFFEAHQSADTQYAEDRPEQRDMARIVSESFSAPNHAVIEAGTGVGKSKAYLVPATLFAVKNGIPVVVSTYTKALQDQLFVKEIPHIKATVKPDLRVAVLKGKQNYVCLKKFGGFVEEVLTAISQRSLYEHTETQTRFTTRLGVLLLSAWLLDTERGDWDELPYWLVERIPKRVMQDICNIDELCTRDVCELYDAEKCFLAKARLRAKDADLVILNHAILLTGIRKKIDREEPIEGEDQSDQLKITYTHPVLPSEAKFVVIDEAHHLEDAATSAWTLSLSQYLLDRLMRQLYDDSRGARPLINRIIRDTSDNRLLDLGGRFDEAKNDLQLDINTLFKEILEKIIPLNPSSKWATHLLFTELSKTPAHMEPLIGVLRSIEERLRQVASILTDFSKRALDKRTRKGLGIRSELTTRIANTISKLLGDDTYFVRFLERDHSIVILHAAPLSTAGKMKDLVYDNFHSVVLTSATITVEDRFNFFAHRCGTELPEKGRVRYMQRASSFDYSKQVKFFVPRGISYTNGKVEKKKHFEQSITFLREAITASQGGSLVLCSSHEQVEMLYEGLREPLANRSIWLLHQSKNQSITSVVRDFTNDLNSVLIGTASLWQGVDVPGQSLRALFIYKIPYRNPQEPIIGARREEIDRQGGNSFATYYQPLAAIDLKQGFGRLIRKKTDIGIAVLLDERITQRPMLMKSFPPGVSIQVAEQAVILEELSRLSQSVNQNNQAV